MGFERRTWNRLALRCLQSMYGPTADKLIVDLPTHSFHSVCPWPRSVRVMRSEKPFEACSMYHRGVPPSSLPDTNIVGTFDLTAVRYPSGTATFGQTPQAARCS